MRLFALRLEPEPYRGEDSRTRPEPMRAALSAVWGRAHLHEASGCGALRSAGQEPAWAAGRRPGKRVLLGGRASTGRWRESGAQPAERGAPGSFERKDAVSSREGGKAAQDSAVRQPQAVCPRPARGGSVRVKGPWSWASGGSEGGVTPGAGGMPLPGSLTHGCSRPRYSQRPKGRNSPIPHPPMTGQAVTCPCDEMVVVTKRPGPRHTLRRPRASSTSR